AGVFGPSLAVDQVTGRAGRRVWSACAAGRHDVRHWRMVLGAPVRRAGDSITRNLLGAARERFEGRIRLRRVGRPHLAWSQRGRRWCNGIRPVRNLRCRRRVERDRESKGQRREDDECRESTHKNPPVTEPPGLGAANYTPYHGAMKMTRFCGPKTPWSLEVGDWKLVA